MISSLQLLCFSCKFFFYFLPFFNLCETFVWNNRKLQRDMFFNCPNMSVLLLYNYQNDLVLLIAVFVTGQSVYISSQFAQCESLWERNRKGINWRKRWWSAQVLVQLFKLNSLNLTQCKWLGKPPNLITAIKSFFFLSKYIYNILYIFTLADRELCWYSVRKLVK